MKKFFKSIDQKWKVYALAGCVCILFFLCVSHLGLVFSYIGKFFAIFTSAIMGAVMAYIFNPVAVFLSKKIFKGIKRTKLNWTLSVVITLIIIFALLSLLMASLIPQVISSLISLVDNLNVYVDNLYAKALELSAGNMSQIGDMLTGLVDSIAGDNGILTKIASVFTDNIKGVVQTASNIGGSAANWGIGIIFCIYFMFAKDAFKKRAEELMTLTMSSVKYYNVINLLSKFHVIFSKYIIFELIDAIMVGVLNYIFMLIMKMPDALFISFIAAVTNLIPTFGPVIGAVISGVILLLVSPSSVIAFVIFTIVLQILDGYVIKPKLFGGALDVPGVVILLSIIVFGNLMGIVGMLLAIPFAAILVYIYDEMIIPYLALKKDMNAYNKEQQTIQKTESDRANEE